MDDARGDVLAFLPPDTACGGGAGLAGGCWFFRHKCSYLRLLFLSGDCLRRALARARIRMGALTAGRQTLTVPEAAVCAEIHEALDVHGHFTPQVALHDVVAVDHLAYLKNLGIGKLIDPLTVGQVDLFADFPGIHRANAMNITQGNDDAFVCWYIDTCNSSHATSLLLGRGIALAAMNP